jgi:tetratricopeptide (TPR) repeat protein
MGVALLNRGEPERAVEHFEAALRNLPLNAEAQYQPHAVRSALGETCLQLGRYPEAAVHLREAVRLDGSDARTRYVLALALALQGETEESMRQYREAIALKPGIDTSITLHEALSVSYAKNGRTKEAIRSAERALEIAKASGKQELAARVQGRLEQYRSKLLIQKRL